MHRLRNKILLLSLGPLLAAAFFLTLFGTSGLRQDMEDEFRIRGVVLLRTFLSVALARLPEGDVEGVRQFLDALLADPDLAAAHLFDPQGVPLICKCRGGSPGPGHQVDRALFALALGSDEPQSAMHGEGEDRRRVHYHRVPLKGPGGAKALGVAGVTMSFRRRDRNVRRSLHLQLIVAVFFILMTALHSLLISLRTVRPIEDLRAAARALGAGFLPSKLPVQDEDEVGELSRDFLKMSQDIQKSREIALKSEKMATIGQMAAGIAHDVKSPLSGAILALEELKNIIPATDPDIAMLLDAIERETHRCSDFVQNLLVFSRSSKPDARETVYLNATVESALSLVKLTGRIKRVDLVRDLAPDLPSFSANKNQVQEVVINLCNNAAEALWPGVGTVTVRTRRSSVEGRDGLTLEVEDTGPGIPPEVLPRVFEPFFTTKPEGQGTGLGLAMVQEIARRHGGSVQVRASAGRGAVFTVFFPLVPPALRATPLA